MRKTIFLFSGILLSALLFNCQPPEVTIRQPVAFGTVTSTGTIIGSTGNFTVNHSATGTYIISISGFSFSSSYSIVNATLQTNLEGVISWDTSGTNMVIYTKAPSGMPTDFGFSFMVWTI
jgi:hypothetical protein